jgi:hypothetical protein
MDTPQMPEEPTSFDLLELARRTVEADSFDESATLAEQFRGRG